MQLLLLVLLSVLDLSFSSPLRARSSTGMTVSLTKRGLLKDENGVVNPHALRVQVIRAHKRSAGSLPLTDDNAGTLWHGTITVGTPPVQFTGSSDLFLPGSDCTINCQDHTRYDTSKSSTAVNTTRQFSLAYGDGSTVEGDLFTDTVNIAGLTATQQAVGAATQYSTGFAKSQFPPDGLMGLAFPQISVFKENPVFQSLISQRQTTSPQFAFKLASSKAELYLGGVDTSLFNGSLTETPVVQKGFWQVDLDSVNVAGTPTHTGLSAIIDTGTTLILGDKTSVASLYAAIPGSADASSTMGAGFYSYPCNATPEVSLTFRGNSFAISPELFNIGQVSTDSSDCIGGVAASDNDFWIVGDVFLQNVYTVFNVEKSTVGFATPA
ncbi:hypothetical protein H0H92_004933 [Tricholoma furcatifolium]|nr:hypothetical protein H0H92_004933 [Tricholoma furcatifolium]